MGCTGNFFPIIFASLAFVQTLLLLIVLFFDLVFSGTLGLKDGGKIDSVLSGVFGNGFAGARDCFTICRTTLGLFKSCCFFTPPASEVSSLVRDMDLSGSVGLSARFELFERNTDLFNVDSVGGTIIK